MGTPNPSMGFLFRAASVSERLSRALTNFRAASVSGRLSGGARKGSIWQRSGRLLLLTATMAVVPGCFDLTSLMRDELAIESEMLDQICLIENEAAAQRFIKTYDEAVRKRYEALNTK